MSRRTQWGAPICLGAGVVILLLMVVLGAGVRARDAMDEGPSVIDAPRRELDQSPSDSGSDGDNRSRDHADQGTREPTAGDDVLMTEELMQQEWTSVSTEAGGVDEVACRLLERYRDASDCVLAEAGYLDLLGDVWGCVVTGDGWTDVCVVCAATSEGASQVRILRMQRDEMTELLSMQEQE